VAHEAPRVKRLLPVLLLAAALAPACGKKGPPQPPIRILPAPARDIRLRQVGPEVVLTASITLSRTDGTPLDDKTQVRVQRMPATLTLRPGLVSARYLQKQFEKESKGVVAFSKPILEKAAPGGRLRFRDREVAAAARSTLASRFLYSVVVVDGSGKRSYLPPPVEIEIQEPPPTPKELKAETPEGEVRLQWEAITPPAWAPSAPAAGSGARAAPPGTVPPGARRPAQPPVPLYNVYRRLASDEGDPDAPLNRAPLKETTFTDQAFRYGETYRYSVRALLSPALPLHESAPTAEVEVHPLDVFPPKAPTGLAVAAEGKVLKLYWFPSAEPDLGGYHIYRREAPNGEYTLVGQAGPTDTSYVDAAVRPGVRYYYVIAAIDGAVPPNESPRSEERSDVVPAEAPPPPAPGPVKRATPPPGSKP